jgi:hypothetical protein
MIEVKEIGNYGKNKIDSIETESYFKPILNGVELNVIAETHDIALLLGLERKYCGLNNQFARFACRMLCIKSAWSE